MPNRWWTGRKSGNRGLRRLAQQGLVGLAGVVLWAQPSMGAEQSQLHLSGFFRNQSAMFRDTSLIEYSRNKNQLATERNWFQLDANYRLDDNNEFFVRGWAVHEGRLIGRDAGYAFEEETGINDDFYNELSVREAWWKFKKGPFTLFTGKQIVTWGESIAFRVNDVVNPQDLSFAFGFANLEESRLPTWMIHPLYYLPSFGPFNTNFIEALYVPGIDFGYTHVDYPDKRYMGQHGREYRVNIQAPGGGRFAVRPEQRGNALQLDQRVPGGMRIDSIQFPPELGSILVPPPFHRPLLAGQAPNIKWHIPTRTFENSQFGFRVGTIVGQNQINAIYWRSHEYNPVARVNGANITMRFPEYQGAGISVNRPIQVPVGPLANLPFIGRAEVFYKNHQAFNTLDQTRANAIDYSDTVNYMVALDVTQAYAPWLTSSGNLNLNLEYQGTWLTDHSKDMHVTGYITRISETSHNFLLNVGTSWWWGAVAPTVTGIYNPDGNTILLFPNVVLVPPWTNKYFFKVQYIGILGGDRFSPGGGLFKGKDILFGQVQYNFDLL